MQVLASLLIMLSLVSFAESAQSAMEIHVAPNGSDSNPGTVDKPLATLPHARDMARDLKSDQTPFHIYLHGGTYYLSETFALRAADSGTTQSPIIYSAYQNEKVVISGGVRLTPNWTPHKNGILKADIRTADSKIPTIDQLFVNGQRQILARYPNLDPAKTPFGGVAEDTITSPRLARYANPIGAYVHGLHIHAWGSLHYEITGIAPDGSAILKGGQQMNRDGGLQSACMIENVLEELDAPGEWFLDKAAGTLYYYPLPGMDMASAVVEGAILKELVSIKGSADAPVRGIQFIGIAFAHAARTILDPYENLLRGDWSIARKGAFFIEGAEDCAIQDCTFDALGGNAVFLSNYCRRVNVSGCRIVGAGDSGICVVGNPGAVRSPSTWQNQIADPPDKTPGPANSNYPAKCVIEGNLIHSCGIVGKQTAGVFISMSEEITVRHSTIYNLPRAGICINDGTWGGHIIEANDIFATVQETGDHGPFNSWGRDRHWSSMRKDLAFLDNAKTTIIRGNRFAHWGNHSWGIDLDDGSSNYLLTQNLTLGCSFKLREGYARTVENNICIGPFPPGKHCCVADNDDAVRRNIIVSISDGCIWELIYGNPKYAKEIDYNLYWNMKNGAPMVRLTGSVPQGFKGEMTMKEWQAAGLDAHSQFADPQFVDPSRGDFRLKETSPALAMGFQNFSMDFGVTNAGFKREAEEGHARYDRAREEVRKAFPQVTSAEGVWMGSSAAKEDASEAKILRRADTRKWLGATIKNLIGWGELSATGLSVEKGVLVTEVPRNSQAARAGLQASDVILKVDSKPAGSVQDLEKLFDSAKGKTTLTISRKQKDVEIQLIAGGK